MKKKERKKIAKEYDEASKLLNQSKKEFYRIREKLEKAEKRYFEAQLNLDNAVKELNKTDKLI